MKTIIFIFNILLYVFVFQALISCSGETKEDSKKQNEASETIKSSSIEEYFPLSFESGGERVSDINRYTGQQLVDLITGAADILPRYGCDEAVMATYKTENTNTVVELFSFPNETLAYGLYSVIRPPEANPIVMDTEGFTMLNSIVFVKGKIVARFSASEANEFASASAYNLAEEIKKLLPGRSALPENFALFPETDRVPRSERIYANSFLGHVGVESAHTIDYAIANDTLTLFLADDASGGKYYTWYSAIEKENSTVTPTDFPFDFSYSFKTTDQMYGTIIAGLKDGKLYGILGYSDKHQQFLTDWLDSIKQNAKSM